MFRNTPPHNDIISHCLLLPNSRRNQLSCPPVHLRRSVAVVFVFSLIHLYSIIISGLTARRILAVISYVTVSAVIIRLTNDLVSPKEKSKLSAFSFHKRKIPEPFEQLFNFISSRINLIAIKDCIPATTIQHEMTDKRSVASFDSMNYISPSHMDCSDCSYVYHSTMFNGAIPSV